MEARDPSSPNQRALAAFGAMAAAVGGVLAWALFWFAGEGALALIIGAAATAGSLAALAMAAAKARWFPLMLGYAFAFVVLSWPVLYLVVGYVRYLLTGQTLGD